VSSDARGKMIDSTITLLAMRGLQGTAFSDVLERSGAPRGSIYHHFPGGKDQLVEAAIEASGQRTIRVLDAVDGASSTAITTYFLDLWRQVLVRSTFRAGCAVLAVTVATDSTDLLAHAASIFRAWHARLTELYVSAGAEPGVAASFAMTLIAASEGAVVLSRAQRDMGPFEQVAAHLIGTTPAAAAQGSG
jgi:TetR/AcrR family transcriptional regulator, lmrAB and yxaGH operons repressor